MKLVYFLSVFLGLGLFACSLGDSGKFNLFTLQYDFSESKNGWTGDFSDYKSADSTDCNFQFEYTNLPSNLASNQKSLKLSGVNQGTGLFMFIKKKVVGLKPNTHYTLVFEVAFASNVSSGFAEGDNVFLKVGAYHAEPMVIENDNYYQLNLNKGLANSNGQDLTVIGTIGNPTSNTQDYSLIYKSNSSNNVNPFSSAISNSDGELWLIVGTDSLYKGISTVYYTAISVVLSASN